MDFKYTYQIVTYQPPLVKVIYIHVHLVYYCYIEIFGNFTTLTAFQIHVIETGNSFSVKIFENNSISNLEVELTLKLHYYTLSRQ